MDTTLETSVAKDYTIRDRSHPLQSVTVSLVNGNVHALKLLICGDLGTFHIPYGDGFQSLEFIRQAISDILVEIQIDNDPARAGRRASGD